MMAGRHGTFNEQSARRIAQVVKLVEGQYRVEPARISQEPPPRIVNDGKVRFRNNSGEVVPAYAVLKIHDTEWEGGNPVLVIDQPDTTFRRYYAVNGGEEIAIGGYGRCYLSSMVQVLFDTGTPAVGEGWGAKAGQWELAKGYPGFFVTGPTGTYPYADRVLAVQSEIMHLRGKTDAAHAKDASGTISIWYGTHGTETDTTMNVTAWNRYIDLDSGVWVSLNWMGNGWDMIAGDCA